MNKAKTKFVAESKKQHAQENKKRKVQEVYDKKTFSAVFPLNFQENDMMTADPTLNAISKRKVKQIYAARNDGNESAELTETEQKSFHRFMKKIERNLRFRKVKEKKYEYESKKQGENEFVKPRKKVPGKYLNINYADDPDIVKYNGFYIKKKAVKELNKLKDRLIGEELPEHELRSELRLACRKQERLLKKEKKNTIAK